MTLSPAPNSGIGPAGYMTAIVAGQTFGVPVLAVQDVIRSSTLHRIPRAPSAVVGALNLRGRIVTAIDLRARLGLPPVEGPPAATHIVFPHEAELLSLLVDDVDDVAWLSPDQIEPAPEHVGRPWLDLCDGLHQTEDRFLLILNLNRIARLEP